MQPRNPANALGIDVSHYQGIPDWRRVAASGIRFAYLKATEGSSIADDTFAPNSAGADAAGLAIGAYHFFRASSVEDAVAEGRFFLDCGGVSQTDLAPALDIETMNGCTPKELAKAARAWLEVVEQEGGRRPLVYLNGYYAAGVVGADLSDYPLWLAWYHEDDPPDVNGWNRWTILQYSDYGRVPGISGPVDLNEFDGGVYDLIGYKMKTEDADKITALLSKAWELGVTELAGQPVDRPEIHRLANEVRKASGQTTTDE